MAGKHDVLQISEINFLIEQNADDHRTSKYDRVDEGDGRWLIIRRGQPFTIELKTKDRGYNKKTDIVELMPRYSYGKFTQQTQTVKVEDKHKFTGKPQQWDAIIESSTKDSLRLKVRSPDNGFIGKWQLDVVTSSKTSSKNNTVKGKVTIHILVNPWNKGDQCYLKDQSALEEYILNPIGTLYSPDNETVQHAKSWNFAQFYSKTLPAVEMMLQSSRLTTEDMGNIIKITRAISAQVNVNQGGVVAGNWSDDFSGGKSPLSWVGSKLIIDEYVDSKGNAVKWGQCWVFAALTTTVCRALGIPCRCVSCFAAGHDVNKSLTIDMVYDKDEKLVYGTEYGSDSIWNFHAWNEVWMTRPDLPSGYDGWQVIDSTPQELSEGINQLGPFPVLAAKKGEVDLDYDGEFVFSEVNGDVFVWHEDSSSQTGYSKREQHDERTGTSILTKAVGHDTHENITNLYKYKENSRKERQAVMNAVQKVPKAIKLYGVPSNLENRKQLLRLTMSQVKSAVFGKDLEIEFTVHNDSKKEDTVKSQVNVRSIYYTGKHHEDIKKQEVFLKLPPNKGKSAMVVISAKEYANKLVDFSAIEVVVIARSGNGDQKAVARKKFTLATPKLKVEVVPYGGPLNEVRTVKCSYVNSTPITLTDVKLSYEGDGFKESAMIDFDRPIRPKADFRYEFSITPRKKHASVVMLSITSKQVSCICGVGEFKVSGKYVLK